MSCYHVVTNSKGEAGRLSIIFNTLSAGSKRPRSDRDLLSVGTGIPRPVNINESSLLIKPFVPADLTLLFPNSVDPDETAHNEPSYQDLHCLPFYLMF